MNIAKIIDHTNLKADATDKDIKRLCEEARKFGFRAVCLNSRWVSLAHNLLESSDIKIAPAIDFPLGASPNEARVFQAENARKNGAAEFDVVMGIGDFKAGDYEMVRGDLKELASILPLKVIIETGLLTDEEIKMASRIVKASGAFCVKTSTGFDPKTDIETKARHTRLMRQAVGPDFQIKAAGGIRTLKDVQILLDAGANIIGTSSGIAIMQER